MKFAVLYDVFKILALCIRAAIAHSFSIRCIVRSPSLLLLEIAATNDVRSCWRRDQLRASRAMSLFGSKWFPVGFYLAGEFALHTQGIE
jgi:hypothetical protein